MHDVVIVGGGPAGLATALFLSAAAPERIPRIVVLERDKYPRDKVCAGAIGARADRLLKTLGVTVEVPSVQVGVMQVSLESRVVRHRHSPLGRVVRRVEFDHALSQQVEARGIEVLDGARVQGVRATADGVVLNTPVGDFTARCVVGAGGVACPIRKALGLSRGGVLAQAIEIYTERTEADPPVDTLHFDVRDRDLVGYAWDFPTLIDGRMRMCRGIYQLRTHPDIPRPRSKVHELLRARLAEQGLSQDIRDARRFSVRGFEPDQTIADGRMMLVGEAAGVDPIVGEGIPQAIQFGALAGPYIARMLAQGSSDFSGWSRVARRSPLGVELAARRAAVRTCYTGRSRRVLEGALGGAPWLMELTTAAFSGTRPRLRNLLGAMRG